MRRRPPTLSARVLAAALLAAFGLGAWGCAGMHPTLGPPLPSGMFIYQPPPGGRFDYFVYVGNGDPRMDDRQTRLDRVRTLMAARCADPQVVDLYAHPVDTWPDGTPHITYTVGVDCAPHLGENP